MLEQVNGVLFPGGMFTDQHYQASREVYQYVKNMNIRGKHTPLLGICLGIELLAFYEAKNGPSILEEHAAVLEELDLDFTVHPKEESWVFSDFSWKDLKTLA